MAVSKRKIIFVVTEDWYFWSHRLPMARAARDMGFEVVVATRVGQHKERIESEGFRVIAIKMVRRDGSIVHEIGSIIELVRIYRRERPDIVHHIAIKPILYGSFATLFARVPAVANTFAGLGFLFSRSTLARMLSPIIVLSMKILLGRGNQWITVQNPNDMERLRGLGVGSDARSFLICGSGVDVEKFHPTPEPDGIPVAAFVGRMLRDKGVGYLVDAARILRDKGVQIRIVLVGSPDPANPKSVSEDELNAWVKSGEVEWWGHRDDMAEVWKEINIGVLPTFYPEGIPKSLLEGAASGRALVATAVPGCIEVVKEGETGLLVKERDAQDLARALEQLALDPARRRAMGESGAKRVQARFSEQVVAAKTSAFYEYLI